MPTQPAASGQQSLPMPAQRSLPLLQPFPGQVQGPHPAAPMLPARKAGPSAQQIFTGGAHGGPRLPEHRQHTPLPLLKASPSPGPPRPTHVVVVREKAWPAPNQASADKHRVSSGQHSMINVDARSAPRAPATQGMVAAGLRPLAAPWASGQPLPCRDRPAISSTFPTLLPMTQLGRPHMAHQSAPLNAPQAGRAVIPPTRQGFSET